MKEHWNGGFRKAQRTQRRQGRMRQDPMIIRIVKTNTTSDLSHEFF
jgi:hypothetical protein